MRWPLARGSAAYHPPHLGLLGCVRGYLVRDTTGRPVLPEAARHNRYPATACVSLIWLLEGASAWTCPAERAAEPLPPTLLLGPQSRPFATVNPGPVRSFGIVFAPGALHRLAGLDMANLVDQAVPAERCLSEPWRSWCGTVRAARDDAERIRWVEAFLHASLAQPAWADVAAMGGYSDQAHLCRQARRGTGMSPRELARRANQDEACWLYRVWAQADAPPWPDE